MDSPRRKFYNAKKQARKRVDRLGNQIEMRISFQEWWDIWQQSGHWHERGCFQGQYVMARHNDIGHYEVGNVSIILSTQNNIDRVLSENTKRKIGDSVHRTALKRKGLI